MKVRNVDELPIIVLNITIVVCVAITFILSLFLMKILTGDQVKLGWWVALPFVLGWAIINRILILAGNVDYLPEEAAPWVPALQIIFWVGLVIFLYGLYKVTKCLIYRSNGGE